MATEKSGVRVRWAVSAKLEALRATGQSSKLGATLHRFACAGRNKVRLCLHLSCDVCAHLQIPEFEFSGEIRTYQTWYVIHHGPKSVSTHNSAQGSLVPPHVVIQLDIWGV